MVITDAHLRSSKKIRETKTLYLNQGDSLTQSARDYIKSHHIQVIANEGMGIQSNPLGRFATEKGTPQVNKSEHMTHLRGNVLVPKTDLRIMFRGKLDTLESLIIEAQIMAVEEGYKGLVTDLDEVLNIVRSILAADVKNQEYILNKWLDLSADELRIHSHYPQKYYGVQHLLPSYTQGKTVLKLHKVRTAVRETELWGIHAFEDTILRPDLILALNRLSSLVYILICKVLGAHYIKE